MLTTALAYFLALILSIVLGGLLAFLVKALIAFALLPLLAIFSGGKSQKHTNGSPVVLTVEFLSNIFYGYMANSIGIWVFNWLEQPIDWFYSLFILIAFVGLDIQRMQKERKRLKMVSQEGGIRDRLPSQLFNKQMQEFREEDMLSAHKNTRITAIFGKVAGVLIGGLNLIVRAAS